MTTKNDFEQLYFVEEHKNIVIVEGDRNNKTISCVNIDGSHHQSQEFVKWSYNIINLIQLLNFPAGYFL